MSSEAEATIFTWRLPSEETQTLAFNIYHAVIFETSFNLNSLCFFFSAENCRRPSTDTGSNAGPMYYLLNT